MAVSLQGRLLPAFLTLVLAVTSCPLACILDVKMPARMHDGNTTIARVIELRPLRFYDRRPRG